MTERTIPKGNMVKRTIPEGAVAEEMIPEKLRCLQEADYQAFQCRLLPVLDPSSIIGVRTPLLRNMAGEMWKKMKKEGKAGEEYVFLKELPHLYFEENQLHAFLISKITDFDWCVEEVSRFLPFVDNWATCDQLSPGIFRKHRRELLPWAEQWMAAGDEAEYTVRFGIRMLMDHFLEEEFDPCYLEQVAGLRTEKYYIRMMSAWYFATALAKQYEAVLPLMEEGLPDTWIHHKAICKSLESQRIPPEHKEYLRGLRTGRRS